MEQRSVPVFLRCVSYGLLLNRKDTMPSDTSLPETLLQIAEQQELRDNAILAELQAIHQTLKAQKPNPQARRKSTVNELVACVLLQNKNKDWTAASLAREIGATGQAVGKCKVWKDYCTVQNQTRESNKRARKDYITTESEITEIDEQLDRKMKR
ncbi:MAG: hypothetical protein LBU65_09680 [Planctomycetaceae bacterium]|nr:hypothetical protein [Planctomycetaceae bacterium]